MERLLSRETYHYLFVGDVRDPNNTGIKEWVWPNLAEFVYAPCKFIHGRYLVQRGVVSLAWRSDITTLVFLGDVQFVTTWFAAMVARLRGKRVLFWTHGWTRPETGLKLLLRSSFYRLGHGLLLYGRRARQLAIKYGFRPADLYVIFNSLDYDVQKNLRARITKDDLLQVRKRLFDEPVRPMLVCTSRLIKARGLDMLLEAIHQLDIQGHQVNLLLIGAGPERSALEDLVKTYGLAVRFYGECYDESELAALIMAANVTVAPGKVGLTAIHSLAYGVPVITHDNPDDQMPEWEAIVSGKSGSTFSQGSIMGLAEAIRAWTQTEYTGDDVRRQCYEMIERFYNPDYQAAIIERAISGQPAQEPML